MTCVTIGADTPGPSPAAVRIAHVSDLHVGAESPAALDSLSEDLHGAEVAATVVTGDLTMRARTREFARAKELLDTFPEPTMVVIGNHDVPLTNLVRRMAGPYDKYRAWVTDDLDPLLDLGAARIRGLGSMPRWRWKSGRISDRQADLVRSTFADAPAGTARVVALHHPPSSRDLETLVGAGDFERALVDAQVDVILAGHTHIPAARPLRVVAHGRARTVVEVVAGTATSHRTRGVSRSWSLLEIGAGSISVTTHVETRSGWEPCEPQVLPFDGHGDPAP